MQLVLLWNITIILNQFRIDLVSGNDNGQDGSVTTL